MHQGAVPGHEKDCPKLVNFTNISGMERVKHVSCIIIEIQLMLDKWNLHRTEENSSTYQKFHSSELFDTWNLYGNERKVPFI